ncbi:MAG: alpha/beta hydrolase [Burkholderiales bacterium]|jgi:pimeloyl-ACP methyl ester carboxylesterase
MTEPTHPLPPPHRSRDLPGRVRGRLRSALGVALVAAGCMPPRPVSDVSQGEPLRATVRVGAPLDIELGLLRGGRPGAPRVILVHGTPGDANGWIDHVLRPSADMDVIAIDRPGFGRSGPEGALPRLADQAAAVAALLPDDGSRAVLLGHSLGGPVVARVAADHPDRVSAVVLLAAALDPALETIHPMQRVGAWPPVSAMLPRAIRNANVELMDLKPELEALGPMLATIRAKVVIVHGTADPLVPVANVDYAQARLTGARCVRTTLLEGADHFLPWNAFDVVQRALREALEPAC